MPTLFFVILEMRGGGQREIIKKKKGPIGTAVRNKDQNKC